MMKQTGDEAVVGKKRRAVAIEKRGILWKVEEERMKRVKEERRCVARRQGREL